MLKLFSMYLLFVVAIANASKGSIEFNSSATISVGAIKLADVANIKGNNDLVKRLSELEIGRIDLPGRETRLSIEVIKTFHIKRVIAPESLDIQGAGSIAVRTSFAVINRDSLLNLIIAKVAQKNLGVKGLDWDIEATKLPKEIRIPESNAQVELEIPPRFDGRGNEIAILRIVSPNTKAQQYSLSFIVRRFGLVVRSVQAIQKAQPIQASQVQLERVELTNQPRQIVNSLDNIIGRIPTRTISRGVDIAENWLEKPFAIREGDLITLRIQMGNAQISTQGRALRNGYIGQRIEVENASTGKKFQGTVDQQGAVLVNL